MKSKIQFINEKIKKDFDKLKDSDFKMHYFIERAIKDIEENVFCGIQIPKKLIPKEYSQKYGARNLWKYNLPDAWRLLYSIRGQNLVIFSLILEWLDHKEYEKRFKY